nr:MAG TPA: PVL ORF-50-like family [Caudoviricetes sp.]
MPTSGIKQNNKFEDKTARIKRGWSTERALETPTGADKWHKTK